MRQIRVLIAMTGGSLRSSHLCRDQNHFIPLHACGRSANLGDYCAQDQGGRLLLVLFRSMRGERLSQLFARCDLYA